MKSKTATNCVRSEEKKDHRNRVPPVRSRAELEANKRVEEEGIFIHLLPLPSYP